MVRSSGALDIVWVVTLSPPPAGIWTGEIVGGCSGTWWTHPIGIFGTLGRAGMPWSEKSIIFAAAQVRDVVRAGRSEPSRVGSVSGGGKEWALSARWYCTS